MFKELEFKYNAKDIKFKDFYNIILNKGYKKSLSISSWDIYYTNNVENSFIRFRDSTTPELTKKVKTKESNNWDRVEVDLPLDINRINVDIVNKFSEVIGYKENFRIYKSCFIYWINNLNYVYYVVYDNNINELGRFIEVEVNKEDVENLQDPYEILLEGEKLLEKLGITPQNRMKKSLFELFRSSKNV